MQQLKPEDDSQVLTSALALCQRMEVKTLNQKKREKCRNFNDVKDGENSGCGCLADETIGILEGTTEEIFDLRKCPYDGDLQRCLDDLIDLNLQGILWQQIPHGKCWFEDPEKVKQYIEQTDADLLKNAAEAKKKGSIDWAAEEILDARKNANPTRALVKEPACGEPTYREMLRRFEKRRSWESHLQKLREKA